MSAEMFEPTIPFGEPELARASAYHRYLDAMEAETTLSGVSSRISQLSPSLQADLMRFEQGGSSTQVIEVVAACIRHAKKVTLQLQCGDHFLGSRHVNPPECHEECGSRDSRRPPCRGKSAASIRRSR